MSTVRQICSNRTAFHVEGYEKSSLVSSSWTFDVKNTELAESYKSFGRCLAIDHNVNRLYGSQIEAYFNTTSI